MSLATTEKVIQLIAIILKMAQDKMKSQAKHMSDREFEFEFEVGTRVTWRFNIICKFLLGGVSITS